MVKATNTGKPVQVGSLKISNNSKRLVSKVREEANLLNQVYQQYSSIPSVEPTVQKPTGEVTTEQPIVDTASEETVEKVTQPQQPEVVKDSANLRDAASEKEPTPYMDSTLNEKVDIRKKMDLEPEW